MEYGINKLISYINNLYNNIKKNYKNLDTFSHLLNDFILKLYKNKKNI